MMPETGDVELFSYAYDVSDKMESEEIMSLVAGANFDYIGFIFAETNEFEFIKKSKSIVFPRSGPSPLIAPAAIMSEATS
jgi:hypothetical protein